MDIFSKLKSIFNKRTTVLVLLFFVVSGIIFPNISHAAGVWDAVKGIGCSLSPLCTGKTVVGAAVDALSNGVSNTFSQATSDVFGAIIYAIAIVSITIASGIAEIAAQFLGWVLGNPFGFSYTGFDNPVIATGWPIVRDFANMIIVLGFIIIGLATTLRFRDYEAKRLLMPLIIAALLINFSLVICGIVIDVSNITMGYFIKNVGFMKDGFGTATSKYISSVNAVWVKGQEVTMLKQMIGVVFFSTLMTIVFALFFFLFLFRYFALWILAMLSPIAFVMYVFPGKPKQYFSMWWSNFLNWCIVGIAGGFFLYIGDKMTSKLISNVNGEEWAAYLIPGFLLVIGFNFALSVSAMGAGIVTDRAKKVWSGAKNMAGGAVTGGAKKLASISGAERLALGAKDSLTGIGERVGLVRPGTKAMNQRARLAGDKRSARLAQMSDQEKAQLYKENRIGLDAAQDRAAIFKEFAGKNMLGMIGGKDAQIKGAKEAMKNGVRFNEIIGGFDSAHTADILNNPDKHNYIPASQKNDALAKGFESLADRGHLDMIDNDNRDGMMKLAIEHGMRPEKAEKADFHYGGNNEARLNRITKAKHGKTFAEIESSDPNEAKNIRGTATEQALDETIASMDHDKLRNIDKKYWEGDKGAKRIDKLTPDKISAMQTAPQDVKNEIKKAFLPGGQMQKDFEEAEREYNDALSKVPPDVAVSTNRYNEMRRIRSLAKASTSL